MIVTKWFALILICPGQITEDVREPPMTAGMRGEPVINIRL